MPKNRAGLRRQNISVFSVNFNVPQSVANMPFYALTPSEETGLAVVVDYLLLKSGQQANNFIDWFDKAEDSYPSLSAKFGALKSKEQSIKDTSNATTIIANYCNDVASHIDGILDTAIGNFGDARINFDKVLDAHSKGAYLTQRQYNNVFTGGGDEKTDHVAQFQTLCAGISGLTQPVISGDNVTNMTAVLTDLESRMKTALSTGLGIPSTNANGMEMIDGLVIQIAEDLPQIDAFVKDITNQGMSAGITRPISRDTFALGEPEPAKARHTIDGLILPSHLRPSFKRDEVSMA